MKKPKKLQLSKVQVVPKVASDKVKALHKRVRRTSVQEQTEEALRAVPRITNETLAEHRETVLRGARKYKYPLQHSKHRIVIVSVALLVAGIVAFFVFTSLSLYRFGSTSTFMYRVTQVVPFPVARADDRWVSYESYLFELRRYMHYYRTQQQVDFTTESGQIQLDAYRPRALDQVIRDAYVKQLADDNNVSVSQSEINTALQTLKAQNRLGDSNDELATVTQKFFGWSVADLRRQLRQELLNNKVAATLDTAASTKANKLLEQLKGGADFAELAKANSTDESTKDKGGVYADTAIAYGSQEVPAQVIRALEGLQVGQISDVIITPGAFEIVKLTGIKDGKYQAAHIQIPFEDIQTYVDPYEASNPPRIFIDVPDPADQSENS